MYKDEPKLKELTLRVKEYNTLLRYMGLKDHQVRASLLGLRHCVEQSLPLSKIERVSRPLWRSAILLCYRVGLFAAWGILALPGVVLNAPIFIAATVISRRKAKGLYSSLSRMVFPSPLTIPSISQRLLLHRL